MPDLFKALVHSVVAQQISKAAADTVWNRLWFMGTVYL